MIGPITDFPYLLEQITPHMSADKTLPELHGICFEASGEYLYAIASDRYTLAVSRRKVETGPNEPWSVFVTADTLKSVRAFTKLNRRTPLHLDRRRGTDDDLLSLRAGHLALEVPTLEGELPRLWAGDWRRYVAEAVAADPDLRREVHLSPGMLARWGKAGGAARGEPLTVWATSPRRPLVIACGPDFLGLQMPITVHADGPGETPSSIREQWADALSRPLPVGKAA